MAIFLDAEDNGRFLELLEKACANERVECYAYCLMPNHYHLVVKTTDANVSDAIQRVNSPFAQWWNRRHQRPGHVFQGRFGAQVVQTDGYLLTASRYVVLNPVRAGLVTSPADWPWSSFRATAGLAAVPEWLRPAPLWSLLGTADGKVACRRYREFIAMGDPRRLPRDPVLGDDGFVARFDRARRRASVEVPKHDRRRRLPLHERFPETGLGRRQRERIAETARSEGYTLREIGLFLDVHPTTVCKMLRRTARQASGQRRALEHDVSPSDAAPLEVTPER
jgi:putative transposase